ncbi:hypothetical protein EX86_14835, partial [Staphylococcus aureus]
TKVSMSKVIKYFKHTPTCHCTSKEINNLIEQQHLHMKVMKVMDQSIKTAKKTIKGMECIYGLYKTNRRPLQIYVLSPYRVII